MPLVGLIVVCSIATLLGLALAVAFARAVLYANVLTELDDAGELSRRLRRRALACLREDRDADELGGSTWSAGITPPRAPSDRSVVRLRSPAATSQEKDSRRGLALRA